MEKALFFNGSFLEERIVGEDKQLPDAVNVVGRGDSNDPTGLGDTAQIGAGTDAPRGLDPTVKPQSVHDFLGGKEAPSTAEGPLVTTEPEKFSETTSGSPVNNPQASGASVRAAQADDPNVAGSPAAKAVEAVEKAKK